MHNTVSLNNEDQSQLWYSFRMGKRATMSILKETELSISARVHWHNGMIHTRSMILGENHLIIEDTLTGVPGDTAQPKACFHFEHSSKPMPLDNKTLRFYNQDIRLTFEGQSNLVLEPYMQAEDFNKRNPAVKLSAYFADNLKTQISWKL
jgi:hypothetical protein